MFDVHPGAQLEVLNARITGDLADRGGEITRDGSIAQLRRTRIDDNFANFGGGLVIEGVGSFVGNSVIANNTSIGPAGGLLVSATGDVLLLDTTIDGNVAVNQFGSAIRSEGIARIERSTIINHNATAGVTMIEVAGAHNDAFTALTRTTISGNSDNQLIDVRASRLDLQLHRRQQHVHRCRGPSRRHHEYLERTDCGQQWFRCNAVPRRSSVAVFFQAIVCSVRCANDPSVAPGTIESRLHATDRIDPQAAKFVGPLEDNGGHVLTHRLLAAGSAAIDAGSIDGGLVNESEPNNTIDRAQSLESKPWLLQPDFNAVIPLSQQRPHVTIQGTGDGTFDYYRSLILVNSTSYSTWMSTSRTPSLTASCFSIVTTKRWWRVMTTRPRSIRAAQRYSTRIWKCQTFLPECTSLGWGNSSPMDWTAESWAAHRVLEQRIHCTSWLKTTLISLALEVTNSVISFLRMATAIERQGPISVLWKIHSESSKASCIWTSTAIGLGIQTNPALKDARFISIATKMADSIPVKSPRRPLAMIRQPLTLSKRDVYQFDRIPPGKVAIGQVLQNQFFATEMGFGEIERASLLDRRHGVDVRQLRPVAQW